MKPSIKEQLPKKIEQIENMIYPFLPEEKGLQKKVLTIQNLTILTYFDFKKSFPLDGPRGLWC